MKIGSENSNTKESNNDGVVQKNPNAGATQLDFGESAKVVENGQKVVEEKITILRTTQPNGVKDRPDKMV